VRLGEIAGSPRTGSGKAGARRRVQAWLVDHFLPDGFGAEDEFDEFAGGAFAAISFGGVVGGTADFSRG